MMNEPTACRGCGAPVLWIKTPKGKLMPADPPLVTIVKADGTVHRGHVSHFATCPQASKFRGGGN